MPTNGVDLLAARGMLDVPEEVLESWLRKENSNRDELTARSIFLREQIAMHRANAQLGKTEADRLSVLTARSDVSRVLLLTSPQETLQYFLAGGMASVRPCKGTRKRPGGPRGTARPWGVLCKSFPSAFRFVLPGASAESYYQRNRARCQAKAASSAQTSERSTRRGAEGVEA
jgi:hypothetical protein